MTLETHTSATRHKPADPPAPASPSPFQPAAAPTAPPRTAGTSGRSPGSRGPARTPTRQFGLSASFPARKQTRTRDYTGVRRRCFGLVEDWRRLFTLGRLLCSSDLCFSSLRRFPPLLVNLAGSVAFFCEKKDKRHGARLHTASRLCSGCGESQALFRLSACFGREHFCKVQQINVVTK